MSTPQDAPPARICLVCGQPLTWPSLYFDRAACVETWIRQAGEREGKLA